MVTKIFYNSFFKDRMMKMMNYLSYMLHRSWVKLKIFLINKIKIDKKYQT